MGTHWHWSSHGKHMTSGNLEKPQRFMELSLPYASCFCNHNYQSWFEMRSVKSVYSEDKAKTQHLSPQLRQMNEIIKPLGKLLQLAMVESAIKSRTQNNNKSFYRKLCYHILCRYRKQTDIHYSTWSFENVSENCQFWCLDPPPPHTKNNLWGGGGYKKTI